MHQPEDILHYCEERKILLIKMQFVDLLGELKQFEVPFKIPAAQGSRFIPV